MGGGERRTALAEEVHQGPPCYRALAGDARKGLGAQRAGMVSQGVGVGIAHGFSPFTSHIIPFPLDYNTAHGHIIGEAREQVNHNDMVAFVRAVDRGGFSAAARDLGLTPSAVSKLVTRLEDRLGVRLLNRTTRSLALTPEGEAYFHRSQRILADIADAEEEVGRFRGQPRGLLRVNVGSAFGMHQLAPALPEFLARHPEIQVELTITDRLVDLIEEGADIGIRLGMLADSTLVARRICEVERMVCASPEYLGRHGTPRRPAELAGHNCLTMANAPALRRWPFAGRDGVEQVEVSGNVSATSADALLQLALRGLGVIRLSDVIVGAAIREGRLVPLLEAEHHREALPLHAVYPQGRHRSPRVAAMIDFLVERFSLAPWRVAPPGKAGGKARKTPQPRF
jgi:DNA-binding transcriptional LysR family regulator